MPAAVAGPELDVAAIAPLICVGLGALLIPLLQLALEHRQTLLGRALTPEGRGTYLAAATLLFLVAALILSLIGFGEVRAYQTESPLLSVDAVARFLWAAVLVAALLTVLSSARYLASVGVHQGEYYALLLASLAGILLLCAAVHLLAIVIALELTSLPLYALVGLRRDSLRSGESALKYFLTGAFASALLVYGAALVYGVTGELGLREIGGALDPESPVALLGCGLLLAGLAFRVAAVPFHQWVPDTYQGAPTSVAGFMATAVTVGAFAVLVRVVTLALPPLADRLAAVLWVLAVASMSVGNLMALLQRNLKRMLGWSAIAHTGYLLMGVLVGGPEGLAALLFYLLAYVFMTLGAFTAVVALARDSGERDTLQDLEGLARTRPFIAVCLSVCAFSLLGVPGTAGFIGRFELLTAAISRGVATGDGWLVGVVVIAVINTAISVVYYLRLPGLMFMREAAAGDVAPTAPGTLERIVLLVCALACLVLGLSPHDALPGMYDLDLLRLAALAAASLH